MDEKVALSLNKLNQKLKEQIAKRADAPPPTPDVVAAHGAVVAAPAAAVAGADFFTAWDTYYPKIVSLLGWASWVFPAPTITAIKGLLAVVNNQIIPILRNLVK